MNLCPYANILGRPDTGIHQYRIFNIAIADVVLTVIGAYLLHYFYDKIDFWTYLVILIILGIVLHRVFCVRTTVDKLLFPYN